jgi:hypothetical protein
MERLTKWIDDKKAICIKECEKECIDGNEWCPKCKPLTDVLVKLADFEDKQEQGLLAEVIRCKDCKYFSGGGLWDNGHWCGRTARAGACDKVAENDFCSKAEALAKMGGK